MQASQSARGQVIVDQLQDLQRKSRIPFEHSPTAISVEPRAGDKSPELSKKPQILHHSDMSALSDQHVSGYTSLESGHKAPEQGNTEYKLPMPRSMTSQAGPNSQYMSGHARASATTSLHPVTGPSSLEHGQLLGPVSQPCSGFPQGSLELGFPMTSDH